MSVGRFRKKPVVIEAVQLNAANVDDVMEWIGERAWFDGEGPLKIHTPEGVMGAVPGDWIIKGIKGEFYPCRRDIFEASYEPFPPPPRRDE